MVAFSIWMWAYLGDYNADFCSRAARPIHGLGSFYVRISGVTVFEILIVRIQQSQQLFPQGGNNLVLSGSRSTYTDDLTNSCNIHQGIRFCWQEDKYTRTFMLVLCWYGWNQHMGLLHQHETSPLPLVWYSGKHCVFSGLW